MIDICYRQKLIELDEITKRLQSRLRDVTNMAFEDEFDNDFDIIESNSDIENTNNRNVETILYSQSTVSKYSSNETSQMLKQCEIQNDRNVINDETSFIISNNSNLHLEPASNKNRAISEPEATDTGYCSSSNTRFSQHPDYYNWYQNRYSSMHNYLSDSNTEYPMRGTKTHINHLLEKLSLDLPPRSSSVAAIPIRKNILELFASLQEHRNNSQKDKNDHDINIYTMFTQTDNEQRTYSQTNFITSKTTVGKNISVESPHNRISTVIREELVAEENNNSTNCDELTTYLITSNIRHMDLDNVFNPLLYQHLVPDSQVAVVSPEEEAMEQLDNRYVSNFDITMRNSNINHSKENNTPFQNDAQLKDWITALEVDKKKQLFSLTSLDISENNNSSTDMTVIYKSSENDLTLTNNSAESTAITSLDRLSVQAKIEVKDSSSLSELSVPGVLRQAPEGGNPIEEVKTLIVPKWQSDIQDVSTDS